MTERLRAAPGRMNQGAAEPSLITNPGAQAPEALMQRVRGARVLPSGLAAESQEAEAKDRPCLLAACPCSCKQTEPSLLR